MGVGDHQTLGFWNAGDRLSRTRVIDPRPLYSDAKDILAWDWISHHNHNS